MKDVNRIDVSMSNEQMIWYILKELIQINSQLYSLSHKQVESNECEDIEKEARDKIKLLEDDDGDEVVEFYSIEPNGEVTFTTAKYFWIKDELEKRKAFGNVFSSREDAEEYVKKLKENINKDNHVI